VTDERIKQDEPLELAWRVALRWRTLGCQFAGTFLVLTVLVFAYSLSLLICCPVAHAVIMCAALTIALIVSIETGAAVMARAWAEFTGDSEFRVLPFLARTIVPSSVVGCLCGLVVVILSIFPHCVLILLTSTGALGRVIFGLALVPMFIVAFLELLLVLAARFIFPPMLVESSPGAAGAIQCLIDSVVGCKPRDIAARVRAFVTALLVALPILIAAGLCVQYIYGLAAMVEDARLPLFVCNSFAGWVTGFSALIIGSALAAAPLAYLNTACLMVHRATQA